LAELRDATNFARWLKNKEGWDTLEEHCDPRRCAGVTMTGSPLSTVMVESGMFNTGNITEINLASSNLVGGESSHLFNHVLRTTS
jgi:hypothetical protein